MTDGKGQFGPAKNLRVSLATHRAFTDYQHSVRAKSAEEAMRLLVGEDVLRIAVPGVVRERWQAAADEAGFPLPQWVAQKVEAAIAYQADAHEIRVALDRLMTAPMAPVRHQEDRAGIAEELQCGRRHGDVLCVLGRGHTGLCRDTVAVRPETVQWGPCSACTGPDACRTKVQCSAEQVPPQ